MKILYFEIYYFESTNIFKTAIFLIRNIDIVGIELFSSFFMASNYLNSKNSS